MVEHGGVKVPHSTEAHPWELSLLIDLIDRPLPAPWHRPGPLIYLGRHAELLARAQTGFGAWTGRVPGRTDQVPRRPQRPEPRTGVQRVFLGAASRPGLGLGGHPVPKAGPAHGPPRGDARGNWSRQPRPGLDPVPDPGLTPAGLQDRGSPALLQKPDSSRPPRASP